MRLLFLFLLHLFFLQNCIAQRKTLVANLKMNIAYVGLENPIQVMIEGYECDQIEMLTDNGIISKENEECQYTFVPKFQGSTTLFIMRKSDKLLLDSCEFRAKLTPNPTAEIYPINDGIFHRRKINPGIVYVLKSFNYDVRFVGQRYSVSIVRDGDIIFKKNNIEGALFQDISEGLSKIKNGDKIQFHDLIVRGPDNVNREITPIELIVAE